MLNDIDITISEQEFQNTITTLAKSMGWLVYHTYDSRRSTPGFPDLVLVRGNRIMFRELKKEIGKLTGSQRGWLDSLAAAGADAGVWRPSQLDEIYSVLVQPLGSLGLDKSD